MVLASLGQHAHNAATVIALWVPKLLGALLILIIGFIVAKFVGGLISRLLNRAGLDRTLHKGQGGSLIQRVVPNPSNLLGRIAFWVIFLAAISLAATKLGIPALSAFIAAIWAYIPNVIAALAIFLVAGAISAAVAGLVTRTMGETPLGKIVATVVPILVMSIAAFMILEQLKIAHDIVVTTYTLLLGAVALGAALAFGLGGREVAGRMLEGAYEAGQQNKEQYKRDLSQGVDRAKEQATELKEKAQSEQAGTGVGATTDR